VQRARERLHGIALGAPVCLEGLGATALVKAQAGCVREPADQKIRAVEPSGVRRRKDRIIHHKMIVDEERGPIVSSDLESVLPAHRCLEVGHVQRDKVVGLLVHSPPRLPDKVIKYAEERVGVPLRRFIHGGPGAVKRHLAGVLSKLFQPRRQLALRCAGAG